MTIREAQVALWQAMRREDAAHQDQNADLYELLKVCPAVREVERGCTAMRQTTLLPNERREKVSAHARTQKAPENEDSTAARKGRAATHS